MSCLCKTFDLCLMGFLKTTVPRLGSIYLVSLLVWAGLAVGTGVSGAEEAKPVTEPNPAAQVSQSALEKARVSAATGAQPVVIVPARPRLSDDQLGLSCAAVSN